MIELLSPAGNMDCLKAAVQGGADAVYLAGKQFGARATAGNFDDDELHSAVRYAHVRSVKIYVTVNTLVNDGEFAALGEYIRQLCACRADALIVQDTGVADYIRSIAPDMPLHASTQMTIQNPAALEFAAALGIRRVVLPRELNMREIGNMVEKAAELNIETEVFAHGALCYCVSGQCLMSSLIGGRSGNRGRCAQPCRMSYALATADGRKMAEHWRYPLSPKDLRALEMVPQLAECGVASLKIEGRLKPPEYVYTVTKNYRAAIDAYYGGGKASDGAELHKVFNRGFTAAYLADAVSPAAMSQDKPNNRGEYAGAITSVNGNQALLAAVVEIQPGDTFVVECGGKEISAACQSVDGARAVLRSTQPCRAGSATWRVTDVAATAAIAAALAQEQRTIPIAVTCELAAGQPLFLRAADNDGNIVEVTGARSAEDAVKAALTVERLETQLRKLGDTPFKINSLQCDLPDGLSLPLAEINQTRRQLIAALEEKRGARFPQAGVLDTPCVVQKKIPKNTTPDEIQLTVACGSAKLARIAAENGADAVVLTAEGCGFEAADLWTAQRINAFLDERAGSIPVYVELPRIIFPHNTAYCRNLLRQLKTDAIAGFYGGADVAAQLAAAGVSAPYYAAAGLPLFNSRALEYVSRAGYSGGLLSPELTMQQIRELEIPAGFAAECYGYGRLELMVSPLCLPGMALGGKRGMECSKPCRKLPELFLQDRRGERFPLRTDQFCRMHVFNCHCHDLSAHCREFVAAGIKRLRLDARLLDVTELKAVLEGFRNAMQGVTPLKQPGTTRGHYFRGVE